MELKCSVCQQPIQISWNFCPNCGNTLHAKPLSTSVAKQLLIYAISFFLPPFGLGYAVKYLRQPESKAKIIGFISIFLTVFSIVLLLYSFKLFMDYYSKILNDVSTGHYP